MYVIRFIIETGVQYCFYVVGKSDLTPSTIHKFSIYHLMNSSKIYSKKKRDSFYLLKPFYVSFLSITDSYIRVLFSKKKLP